MFLSSVDVFETTSRYLDQRNIFALFIRLQNVLIKTNIYPLIKRFQNVFKKYSKELLQEVFETSSRRLYDFLPTHLQDIFKSTSKRLAKIPSKLLQDIFKTSSGYLEVFYYQIKLLLLLTRLQNDSKLYLTRFWEALQRQLSTERFAYATFLRNLWSRVNSLNIPKLLE